MILSYTTPDSIIFSHRLLHFFKPLTDLTLTFIEKAKRYTTIDELTPELLRLFIQRIEIGERSVKYSRNATQTIRIIYRDIGIVDSAMGPNEQQPYIAPPLSEACKELMQKLA